MIDVKNLSLDNLGDWPIAAKIVLMAILFAVIIFLGFWIDGKSQLKQLSNIKNIEMDLKTQLQSRYTTLGSLNKLNQKVTQQRSMFDNMVKQDQQQIKVEEFLEIISTIGSDTGITFELLRPMAVQRQEFYESTPVELEVQGTYHQLAEFVSKIANINNSVAFRDVKIKRGSKSLSEPNEDVINDKILDMELIAEIYRYLPGKTA